MVIHSFYGIILFFSLYIITHYLKVSSVSKPDSRHVWTIIMCPNHIIYVCAQFILDCDMQNVL